MDVLELIKQRTAIRRYKFDKSISNEDLYRIIEAGLWSPSIHNFQPWFFVIITKRQVIKQIANVVLKESLALHVGYNKLLRLTSENIANSPAIIVVYNNKAIQKSISKFGKLYAKCAVMSEIEGISGAISNMLLCAHSLGLGANWLVMPIFCEQMINKILKINYDFLAILTLGYPAEKGRRSPRKSIKEKLMYISEYENQI